MESIAPKLILVPTDFSAPATQALRYGAALAERVSAHLLVIFADPFVQPVDYTIGTAGLFGVPREERVEATRVQLHAFVEANVPRSVSYDARILIGTPIVSIIDQASETGADLIVMGTHGRTGLRRLLVGSVTEAVMRLASVPVIVVHDSVTETAAARWIVGCATPARECRAALQYARLLADDAARFVLVGSADVADRPMDAKDVVTAAETEKADLIVLGIGADRSLADELRGTTAERVVQRSMCPVLTVNHLAAA